MRLVDAFDACDAFEKGRSGNSTLVEGDGSAFVLLATFTLVFAIP